MPKGPKGEKRPADVIGAAVKVMQIATGEIEEGITPAMAAGISKTLWSMEDIVVLVDAAAPKPGRRGSYKKRNSN